MNEPEHELAFQGVGWGFPVRRGTGGGVATARYEDDIRESIHIILGTNPGERVMRPDFGAGLNAFVFEPVNMTTMQRLRTRVEESLIDWEPRIDVLAVDVGTNGRERNRLDINLEYRVRTTNSTHNLVYPFYLEEGGGS